MINFTGYSVLPTKRYLHIQNTKFLFNPITTSTSNPPLQSFRLMNRGSIELTYSIDTSSLEKVYYSPNSH